MISVKDIRKGFLTSISSIISSRTVPVYVDGQIPKNEEFLSLRVNVTNQNGMSKWTYIEASILVVANRDNIYRIDDLVEEAKPLLPSVISISDYCATKDADDNDFRYSKTFNLGNNYVQQKIESTYILKGGDE